MGKKKPFIDKKNSITFKLVGRSPNDPLFVDENAPQYVLVEKKTKKHFYLDADDDNNNTKVKNRKEEQIKYGIYFDDEYDYLQHLADVQEVPPVGIEVVKSKDDSSKKPNIMLPSSVFESTVREKEDINKKAALPVGPQLDWDPDIVEAMQDDFNFENPENQIDDDFVIKAMNDAEVEDDCAFNDNYKYDFVYKNNSNFSDKISHHSDDEQFESDDNLSMCNYDGSEDEFDEDEARDQFDLENTKMKLLSKKNFKKFFGLNDMDDQMTMKSSASTHFTDYSISSSVLPRNDNLKLLDEKFEQMFIREYADDTTIGALDCEEISGSIDPNKSELMSALVEEYEEAREGVGLKYETNDDAVEYVRQYLKQIEINTDNDVKENAESLSSDYEEIEINDVGRKGDKNRFDCESILSTYSNTLYHPKILKDTDRYGNLLNKRKDNHIQIDPKTGIPVGAFSFGGLNAANLAALEKMNKKTEEIAALGNRSTRSVMSRLSELSVRPKNETSDEKRTRKKELKEFRALRRIEKKANRVAFNDEKIRLNKTDINKAVQKKVAVI